MPEENGNGADPKDNKEFSHINYEKLPKHTRESMEGYIEYGWEPSGFIYSILTNDLLGTVKRADTHNRYHLLEWIDFCLEFLPGDSWGSPEKVAAWMKFRREYHGGE